MAGGPAGCFAWLGGGRPVQAGLLCKAGGAGGRGCWDSVGGDGSGGVGAGLGACSHNNNSNYYYYYYYYNHHNNGSAGVWAGLGAGLGRVRFPLDRGFERTGRRLTYNNNSNNYNYNNGVVACRATSGSSGLRKRGGASISLTCEERERVCVCVCVRTGTDPTAQRRDSLRSVRIQTLARGPEPRPSWDSNSPKRGV